MKLSFEEVVVLTTVGSYDLPTKLGVIAESTKLGASPKFDDAVALEVLGLLILQKMVRDVGDAQVEITKRGRDALQECRTKIQAIAASVTKNTEFK